MPYKNSKQCTCHAHVLISFIIIFHLLNYVELFSAFSVLTIHKRKQHHAYVLILHTCQVVVISMFHIIPLDRHTGKNSENFFFWGATVVREKLS